MIDVENYVRFERVDSVRSSPRGLTADLHGEQLRIEVVADDVVRLKISRGGRFDEEPTFAVCVDPFAEDAEFRVEHHDDSATLSTATMVVSLYFSPFHLEVHRHDGSPVLETAQDATGRYWAYATLNDAFAIRRRYRPDDAVYGLGEKTGSHNRRGRDFTMWNTDVLDPKVSGEIRAALPGGDPRGDPRSTVFDPYYMTIPFFYHQQHSTGDISASFVDNAYRSRYDFRSAKEFDLWFGGGQYTEYIFSGPTMPAILKSYTKLTGRTARPPVWSLGYHQSRWFDYAQDDVVALAARHRENGVPCDCLWLDIDYMDGYRVFTWKQEKYPDPQAMISELDSLGFKLVTIVDPGVKFEPGYWVFDQAKELDVLCRTEGGDIYVGQVWPGRTAFPDFATESARRWWGELNSAHVLFGLAGIWNDMNEPATGSIPPDRMRFDHGRQPHSRYHNQYALLMAMGTTEGLLKVMPDRRTFVLSRAGFAGIQRYAANWLGDNSSRWDHLWMSMPMAAGVGISGQAFVGADAGGFQGHSNAELFLRWMQYAALTPFFRNHSEQGNVDQYAWSFGRTVLDCVRRAIELRYRLIPYLYAAFVAAAERGAPVQRPLVFDHQYDPAVLDIDDEFLLGGDLLVAPVFQAGATARQVYLPAGTWYDWWTDERLPGESFVLVSTPMDRIPLYARGGAVIPMWPTAPAHAGGYYPETIDLHLFVPAEDGEFSSMLHEDDGVSFSERTGEMLRTELLMRRSGNALQLIVTTAGSPFPEHVREHFRVIVHGADPAAITVDEVSVEKVAGSFAIRSAPTAFSLSFGV